MMRQLFLALLLALAAAIPAHAHKPSDSYLALRVEGRDNDGAAIDGQWDIALRDLDNAIGLDADGDGQLTWDEIRSQHSAIAAYALSRLSLSTGGAPCTLSAAAQLVDRHTDGAYTVLRLRGKCPVPAAPPQSAPGAGASLQVSYRLFSELDAQHRGLLRIEHAGATQTAILGGDHPQAGISLVEPSRLGQFAEYVRHGTWHIWIGFDHILFLVSLLLPAVLAGSFRAATLDVLKIVTAFSLAHSITLTLAVLQVVSIPSRWVESAIAASVAIAALNNLWPVVTGKRWLVAFVFGLIHGFGFASVLSDLGLPQGAMILSLLGFNVGVELGQLAIVAAFLPLAYAMRGTMFYRRGLLTGGSCAITLVALAWLGERALYLPQ